AVARRSGTDSSRSCPFTPWRRAGAGMGWAVSGASPKRRSRPCAFPWWGKESGDACLVPRLARQTPPFPRIPIVPLSRLHRTAQECRQLLVIEVRRRLRAQRDRLGGRIALRASG